MEAFKKGAPPAEIPRSKDEAITLVIELICMLQPQFRRIPEFVLRDEIANHPAEALSAIRYFQANLLPYLQHGVGMGDEYWAFYDGLEHAETVLLEILKNNEAALRETFRGMVPNPLSASR